MRFLDQIPFSGTPQQEQAKLCQQSVRGQSMAQCPSCGFVNLEGYRIMPAQCYCCGTLIEPLPKTDARQLISNRAMLVGMNGKVLRGKS